MRTLCLYIPKISVQLALRRKPQLERQPLVVLAGSGDRATVVEAAGGEPGRAALTGIPAAQARRRCPRAVFLPDNLGACLDELERLAGILRKQGTPLVEVGGRNHLFLDIRGLAERFGSEAAAAERLAGIAATWSGFEVRAAVARGRGAALQAAQAARLRPAVLPDDGEVAAEPPIRDRRGSTLTARATFPGPLAQAEARMRLRRVLARLAALLVVNGQGFRELTLTVGAARRAQVQLRSETPVATVAEMERLLAGPLDEGPLLEGADAIVIEVGRLSPAIVERTDEPVTTVPQPAHALREPELTAAG